MNATHEPALPPRPAFVERTAFDERNEVLFLLLGLVSVAERILSVVPELVESPATDIAPETPRADDRTGILR